MNRTIAAAGIIAWLAITGSQSSHAAILKVMDYENGTYSGCGTLVTSPTRAGKYAVKIALNATTKEVNTRCEIPTNGGKVGGEYWYGTSFYFPADWPDVQQPTRSPHYCISQWINWQGNGCFPFLLQLQVIPGYKFQTFWYKNDQPSGSGGFATIKRGAWNDIVVHAKWSLSNTFVEFFHNGKKVWQHSGGMGENCAGSTPSLGYRASLYSQHHFGPARYLIHDEYRMGDAKSSLAEVSPRSGATEIVRYNIMNPADVQATKRNELRVYSVDGRLVHTIADAKLPKLGPDRPFRIEIAR